jgi:hypothetical protein
MLEEFKNFGAKNKNIDFQMLNINKYGNVL